MACDARLPNHAIYLPHECLEEDVRFPFTIEGEEMSFCPYHFAYLARMVLKAYSEIQYQLIKGLVERMDSAGIPQGP